MSVPRLPNYGESLPDTFAALEPLPVLIVAAWQHERPLLRHGVVRLGGLLRGCMDNPEHRLAMQGQADHDGKVPGTLNELLKVEGSCMDQARQREVRQESFQHREEYHTHEKGEHKTRAFSLNKHGRTNHLVSLSLLCVGCHAPHKTRVAYYRSGMLCFIVAKCQTSPTVCSGFRPSP